MSQFGKASSKRGKPTYAYAIIGVSLVLFLFGIVGWFFLNLRKTGDYFKENIQVQCFLNRDASKKRIDSVQKFIATLSSTKSVEYVTKEKAIKKFEADNDTTWRQFIQNNPLPESLDFYVKASHVQSDSLRSISNAIEANFPGVISEYKYPDEIVANIILLDQFSRNINRITNINVEEYTQKAYQLSQIWIDKQYYLNQQINKTVFALLPMRHIGKQNDLINIISILNQIENVNSKNEIFNKFKLHTIRQLNILI